jgi:hypothetical protein
MKPPFKTAIGEALRATWPRCPAKISRRRRNLPVDLALAVLPHPQSNPVQFFRGSHEAIAMEPGSTRTTR